MFPIIPSGNHKALFIQKQQFKVIYLNKPFMIDKIHLSMMNTASEEEYNLKKSELDVTLLFNHMSKVLYWIDMRNWIFSLFLTFSL